jgi:hypothetical protein
MKSETITNTKPDSFLPHTTPSHPETKIIEVCFLYDLRFELCGCSYDGHWRLTWSLTSGPVRGISRGACKLAWTPILNKKKKNKNDIVKIKMQL